MIKIANFGKDKMLNRNNKLFYETVIIRGIYYSLSLNFSNTSNPNF